MDNKLLLLFKEAEVKAKRKQYWINVGYLILFVLFVGLVCGI